MRIMSCLIESWLRNPSSVFKTYPMIVKDFNSIYIKTSCQTKSLIVDTMSHGYLWWRETRKV